jgi:farnesol dehydrogenase
VGTLENKFSFVHVDDVAEGCIAAMRSGKLGERYLLTGDNASFIELLALVDAIRGRTSYNFQVPIWALELVGWVSVLWAKLTGYTPIISSPVCIRPLRNALFCLQISFLSFAVDIPCTAN